MASVTLGFFWLALVWAGTIAVSAQSTRTEYLEGCRQHGASWTQDYNIVKLVTRGSSVSTLPCSDSAVLYAFGGSLSTKIFNVTFTSDSYLNSENTTLTLYDGGSRKARVLGQFQKGSNFQSVMTTQYGALIIMDAGSESSKDWNIEMVFTPVRATYIDFFKGKGTHPQEDVYDGTVYTIMASGDYIRSLPASDYSTYSAATAPDSRRFVVAISSDSYIRSDGVTLHIRDGSQNTSPNLVTYEKGSALSTVTTTQYQVYVEVAVASRSNRDYYLKITLTPEDSGVYDSISAGILAAIICVILIIIGSIVACIMVRRRRLRRLRREMASATPGQGYSDAPPPPVATQQTAHPYPTSTPPNHPYPTSAPPTHPYPTDAPPAPPTALPKGDAAPMYGYDQ